MNNQENFKTELFSDVGMGETFMARLINFETDILQGVSGVNHEKVNNLIFEVIFDGLEPAFRSLRDLRKKWDDKEVPKKEKIQLVENVYSYLVVAFKDRFQNIAKEMGYDISFLFKQQKDFDAGCIEFKKKYPNIDSKFIHSILEYREWSNILVQVRNNVIDHKAGKNPIIVEKLSSFLTLKNAEILFDNCWKSIEDFLVIFAIDKVDPKYGMKIQELTEYKNNNEYEHRFGWFDVSGR